MAVVAGRSTRSLAISRNVVQVAIRAIEPSDIEPVANLLSQLASAYIINEFERSAQERFLAKNNANAIREFIANGYRYHVAESNGELVGFVGMRGNAHLYHLFVAAPLQGHGVGRMLWEFAKRACEVAGHRGAFTVNSSNNAVPIYERWGFRRAGPPENSNGIVYNPMKFRGY